MRRTLCLLTGTILLAAGVVTARPADAAVKSGALSAAHARADRSDRGDGEQRRLPRNARPGLAPVELQNDFDHIGAVVHSLNRHGRTSYYIDEGHPGDRAVVFIGGQGTSLQAFQLTEFARTMREQLGLRVISVERNGFGESSYDPSLGYEDYDDEVLGVLEHLKVKHFAVVAISGGGAYASHLAARVPNRVLSLHAAAAVSSTLPTRSPVTGCGATIDEQKAAAARWTADPKGWWATSATSPVSVIPGWQTVAYLDAVRSFYLGGQRGAPDALAHENSLPCGAGAVADTSRITAPVYLYWGSKDTSVPVSAMKEWEAAIPHVAKAAVYEGADHTVQYRHWDQILADMAGYGDRTVICTNGRTQLVDSRRAARERRRGATLGMCAWQKAGR